MWNTVVIINAAACQRLWLFHSGALNWRKASRRRQTPNYCRHANMFQYVCLSTSLSAKSQIIAFSGTWNHTAPLQLQIWGFVVMSYLLYLRYSPARLHAYNLLIMEKPDVQAQRTHLERTNNLSTLLILRLFPPQWDNFFFPNSYLTVTVMSFCVVCVNLHKLLF